MVKLQIQCNVCGKVFWSKCTRLKNVHPRVTIPVKSMCKKCENGMKHFEQLRRNDEVSVKQAKWMMEKEDYEPDTLITYHGED